MAASSLLPYDGPLSGGTLPPTLSGSTGTPLTRSSTRAPESPRSRESALRAGPARRRQEEHREGNQTLSSVLVSQFDAFGFQEQWDRECTRRHARVQGVCPIREAIYDDAFAEVVRQTAVGCPDRGRLLGRVRAEILTTLEGYQATDEAASQLGARWGLSRGPDDAFTHQLARVKAERDTAERELTELKATLDALEKREVERRQAEEQRHKEEVAFLKKTNTQLAAELKRHLS